MEIVSRQLSSKKSLTNLYMKSQLQTVEEFAARYGIAKKIIKECVNLGLIKTRKCKGKTFVLDVPASRYQGSLENSNEQLNHQAMHAQRIAGLADKIPTIFPEENTVAKTEQADSLTKTNTFLFGISAKQTKVKTKMKG